MVSELFLELVGTSAVFYGITPTNMVYLLSLFFSVFLGIVSGVASQSKTVAFLTFISFLFIFSILDLFPLWILAITSIIGGGLYMFLVGREE